MVGSPLGQELNTNTWQSLHQLSSLLVQVKVTFKRQISMNVHPDYIFLIAEPFVNKLGMMMHRYELKCHAKKLVCLEIGLSSRSRAQIIKIGLLGKIGLFQLYLQTADP